MWEKTRTKVKYHVLYTYIIMCVCVWNWEGVRYQFARHYPVQQKSSVSRRALTPESRRISFLTVGFTSCIYIPESLSTQYQLHTHTHTHIFYPSICACVWCIHASTYEKDLNLYTHILTIYIRIHTYTHNWTTWSMDRGRLIRIERIHRRLGIYIYIIAACGLPAGSISRLVSLDQEYTYKYQSHCVCLYIYLYV